MLREDDSETIMPTGWQWPGIWSINLPILAVLWQMSLARVFFADLEFYHMAMTAALVWLFAAGERAAMVFGHARQPKIEPGRVREDAKNALERLWLLIAASVTLVLLFRARSQEAAAVMIFSSLAGIYIALLWRYPSCLLAVVPREFFISAALTTAIVLFVRTSAVAPTCRILSLALLIYLVFFYHNCLLHAWSSSCLSSDVNSALFHKQLAALYRAIPLVLISGGVLFTMAYGTAPAKPLLLSIVVSASILAILDWWSRGLEPAAKRHFADLAMLSPIVPLVLI